MHHEGGEPGHVDHDQVLPDDAVLVEPDAAPRGPLLLLPSVPLSGGIHYTLHDDLGELGWRFNTYFRLG